MKTKNLSLQQLEVEGDRYCRDTGISMSKTKEEVPPNDVIKDTGRREDYLFGNFSNLKIKEVSLSSSLLLRKFHYLLS